MLSGDAIDPPHRLIHHLGGDASIGCDGPGCTALAGAVATQCIDGLGQAWAIGGEIPVLRGRSLHLGGVALTKAKQGAGNLLALPEAEVVQRPTDPMPILAALGAQRGSPKNHDTGLPPAPMPASVGWVSPGNRE